jgi:hypothetical protein
VSTTGIFIGALPHILRQDSLDIQNRFPINYLTKENSYQKEADMKKQRGFLCSAIALAVVISVIMFPPHVLSASTTAMVASEDSSAKKVIILALTQEQAAECERERQALLARLNQCTTDECRREVQKEIDAHNARCQ